MQLSGHKKEKDFYRYIRISAEEAALQIEKIWKEREELLKLNKQKINTQPKHLSGQSIEIA